LKWGTRRADKALPVEAISGTKLPAALAALSKSPITLVIIDTPATETGASEAAIKAADLCVIPVRPTIFDIWSSETTRGRIKTMMKEYVFLLNQCPSSRETQRMLDGAAAIEAMGGLLRPLIASRVDYQEAAREGMGVTEISEDGKAADEMRQLWVSLKKRLGRAKTSDKQSRKVAA
jgi:chromosome partitioning protein